MKKIFTTESLWLCPYLQMNGLKYVGAEIDMGKGDKPVVLFKFEDPRGVGRDLELDYMKSDFKHYKDISFFFRNEIERMNRKLQKQLLDERRKSDDKYYDGESKDDKDKGRSA